ncbi:MAG: hypothetical protein ACFWT2_15670 [Thermoanaerobacterium thermosaccharolyticum]|jgi:hypothetical protein
MTIEQRIDKLEKKLAELEKQIQEQPNTQEIINKIKETLKKEINISTTIDY